MSTNEGVIGEDGFYNGSAHVGEIPVPLACHPHQTQGPPTGGAIPSHIMWPPPQILNQQYIHHQPHAPPPPPPSQQQQQYNELYYNMHPQAYATPPVQSETYSVLPVGHGNFLKVYHRADGGPAVSGANDSILYQQQFQQQQHQHQQQFHLPTPPQAQPPIFNSYELFSSNTLMPTTENSNIASVASANVAAHELSMQPPPPLHLMSNSNELHSTASTATSTTNMIINKLVNNWSPNLTGSTYAQLSAPLGQVHNNASVAIQNNAQNCSQVDVQFSAQLQSVQPQLPATINPISHNNQDVPKLTFNNMPQIVAPSTPMQPGFLPQTAPQTTVPCAPAQQQLTSPQQQPIATDGILPHTAEVRSTLIEQQSSASNVASHSHAAQTTPLQSPEGSKKRIVAEVKPMRMTYSDVLSKFNNQHSNQTNQSQSASVKVNSNRSAKQTSSGASNTQPFNERKADHKRGVDSSTSPSSFTQRQSSIEESSSPHSRPAKKSPTHDNKENVMQGNAAPITNKAANNKQRISGSATNNPINNKNSQKVNQKTVLNDVAYTAAAAAVAASQKKRNKKGIDADFNSDSSNARFTSNNKNNSSNSAEKDFNGFYNIAAKNTDNGSKSATNMSSSNSFRRSAKTSGPTYSTTTNQNYSRNAQRTSNGSAISSAYSYSTKRGRSANASTANNHNTSNRNYEMAKKFLHTWFEYTLKILTWLFYLVNDIVVLGFSMVYERLSHYYACGLIYAQQLRKDLKQNSNKPSIFIRNYLRRFDARFKKNSKWAFWRRFYKKKQPEASADFYKNGRLPQTGEEAMYSLLNCKGKDAYSILGVPPNSSQEQIRKHYKKIAVLVHPDKNKQAGAEEAFKVLQRAFELIGEPENREAYDRGLDEALHAEKAWTELHDLLSQLQTKITEAANTIRCSTCGLRHPRKLTDRPHYAARECASCKIRHSAREGDIWAETTLLGLRWKYLALMEGKVYDITEWANCQKGALSHLEPNSHMVQYRIVRGAQQQQQQQQQMHQQHQQQSNTSSHQQFPHTQGSSKFKRDIPPSEASLHEFLDNLYSGQHPGGQPNPTPFSGTTRKRTRRN